MTEREYVMVERGRWERVRDAAEMWDGRIVGSVTPYRLPLPGDLDPIEAVTLTDADREALAREICEIVGAEDYQLVESDIQKMCGERVDGWYVIVDALLTRWHIVRRTEPGAG